MHKYFASGNRFRLPKDEDGPSPINSIAGTFLSYTLRPGRNISGQWLVLTIKQDETIINAYFDSSGITIQDEDLLDSNLDRTITLTTKNGRPLINTIDVKSEGDIRERLLRGVSEGNVKAEDLPALLAFAQGDDTLFAKWQLFKQEHENESLAQKKEELAAEKTRLEQEAARAQESVDNERDKVDRLKALENTVRTEVYKLYHDLEAQIVFLQGDDTHYCGYSDYLIPIDSGYNKLMKGFEKFRTQRGIFLLCGGKIHEITHAYFEEKGRAYLIGPAREYKTTKPEVIQAISQEINGILFPERLLPDQSTNKDTR